MLKEFVQRRRVVCNGFEKAEPVFVNPNEVSAVQGLLLGRSEVCDVILNNGTRLELYDSAATVGKKLAE